MYGVANNRWLIYSIAIFCSVLLSAWISVREVVVNPDAICYLQSAALFKTDMVKAIHLCDQSTWPFYSALIYFFSSLTSLSYVISAYVLNGIFSLISVLTFLAIVRFLGANTRILWMALLVILLAHDFNSVKQYIIRDHGFWAFYLLSIYFLLRFFRHDQWRFAIAWGLSLLTAVLFRVEGGLFLLVLPFVAWLDFSKPLMQRAYAFLKLNSTIFVLALLGCVWLFVHQGASLGRLEELFYQMLHGVAVIERNFNEYTVALTQHLLNAHSASQAPLLLSLFLVIWYVISVIASLSLIYAFLVFYAWCKKNICFERTALLVLFGYILINVAITAVFLTENMFLSKRYLLALSLVFMLWVPFALDQLLLNKEIRRWPAILVFFLMGVTALGGIFDFGYSKKYLRDAGVWVAEHVPENAKIYSNDVQVMYYTQRFGNDIFVKAKSFAELPKNDWKNYDYLVLHFSKNDNKTAVGSKVQHFANKRGDEVGIFKIPH